MNSVHLVTQEKKRVKTDRKWVECTECTAQGQPARPAPLLRTPRAPLPAVPAPAARAPSTLPARRAPLLHAQRPACALRALPARPASAQRPVHCHNTILYCDIVWPPAACCNTIHCIATQLSSSPSSLLQYNPAFISAIQPLYCNTKTHILAF